MRFSSRFSPALRLSMAALMLVSTSQVRASSPYASLSIATDGGSTINLSMDSMLSTLSDGSVQLRSDLPNYWSDAFGAWSSTTLDGKAAVAWHSWETANGGEFAATTNPWASSFTFTLLGHGDPDMSYAFSAVNNTGKTQTYGYVYGEDIDPHWLGAYDLSATMGVSLSHTDGSATVLPTPGNSTIQKVELSTNGGVSYYNAGVDLGAGFINTTQPTQTFGPLSASTSGYSAMPLTTWRFNTQFTLTNKRDAVAITGTVSLIPEPDTDAMLLAGLGVCGLLVLRAGPRRDR